MPKFMQCLLVNDKQIACLQAGFCTYFIVSFENDIILRKLIT